MSKARIIVVTLSEPYPFGNAHGRWLYVLLKELSRRRYQVRCLSVITNPAWAKLAYEAVTPLGVDLSFYPISLESNRLTRKWHTLRQPFSYSLSSALKAELVKEIRIGYDVLHLEQLWTGYLANRSPRTLVSVSHLPSLDLRGLNVASNPRSLLQRYFLGRSEAGLLRRLSTLTTLSARLASSIQSINRDARVFVVPFALDPSLYRLVAEDTPTEPIIGFVGSMNWMPVFLAARRLITRIFPLVKQLVPKAKLLIAGWQARKALSEFVEYPDVSIVENVPNAEPYLNRLQVFAYPMWQGSGVKVKVLEAMAWGVPVVTTSDGVEGLDAVDGEHCFIADEDAMFAQRVVELLSDVDLREGFRRRARGFVEEHHSPIPVVSKLEQVYQVL